jgi:3-oxoadipate enol-lactonase
MAEIKLDGVSFNVRVEGREDAPAILVGHSLGSDLSQWDAQMESLARRFRVIRYDSRGHGLSEATPGPYSIEQLGRDALGLLDALGVEKTHFMGLSLGGQVGMWLLVNAPERIDRAILANTSACFGHPDIWNMRIKQALAEGLDAMAPATMDRWFTREFQERAPAEVDRILARFRATSAEAYAATVAALRDADLREPIRGVKNRVLVIVGTQDPASPPAAGGQIADQIPGARLVALEAAHLSNIEAANDFTRAIVSFLTAPEPAAKTAAATAAGPQTDGTKTAGTKSAGTKSAETKSAGKKSPARKAVKKAAKKAAKKASSKAAKKPAKKAARAAAKKSAKKTATKTVKKTAGKKSVKKAASKKTGSRTSAGVSAEKAPKKTAKRAAKKTAKKTSGRKATRKPASSRR